MIQRISLLFLSCWSVVGQDGAAIYQKRCASCHDMPTGRVPPFSALRAMTPDKILHALEGGVMASQAAGMSSAERHAVTIYLGAPALQAIAPVGAAALCPPPPSGNAPEFAHWNGWGVDLANSRFQDAANAGLAAGDVPKLKLKWAFGLGDTTVARGQASIVAGRLFTGSESGTVYSLDAKTGCTWWAFQADGAVTAALVVARNQAYFGDQKANVYAVDAATGKLLWKVRADDHFAARVTAAAQLYEGVLYVPVASFEEPLALSPTYECCSFRGSVVALSAATGKRLWKTFTIADPPRPLKKSQTGGQLMGPSGASVWSAPTVDEKLGVIYVATGNNYSDPPTASSDAVLALDRKTGRTLWTRQLTPNDATNSSCSLPGKMNCPEADGPDADFGQPPILVSLPNGRRALVLGQKSGVVYALDPDKRGEVLWLARLGRGGPLGGMQWGSAADHENVYAALSDLQIAGGVADSAAPMGFRLLADPQKGGGLFALRLSNGARVGSAKPPVCGDRKNCSPAQSAAVTAIPGVVFSGSVDGHLRAYSAATGEVVWDVDTVREYDTVNGAKARGGSLDGAGPAIAGGMLYVNSGYGQWGGTPGNVLLAFSVDGK
jgi:polyvinyl alcohol dehydrogenase (cytochrome)